VTIVLDRDKDPRFASYSDPKSGVVEGQEHDAGYDSFMTGHIFACLGKYIEIGQTIGMLDNDGKKTGKAEAAVVTGDIDYLMSTDKVSAKKEKGVESKKKLHYTTL
jgi:hypothetical protein